MMEKIDLTHAQRLQGLDHEDLLNLRELLDGRLEAIREGGKIQMWVVSSDWMNLHWDTSHDRACLFLAKAIMGRDPDRHHEFELKPHKVFAAELPHYERDYGADWQALQAELDSSDTEAKP